METKANTTLIGAFTLLVLALLFGFIYWLAKAGEDNDTRRLDVTFTGAVTGLTAGSQVLFNGIRVGEVASLDFDRADPSKVNATLLIRADTPVKRDTKASLGYTGLTGVAYVELKGGDPKTPRLLDSAGTETLDAESAAMADLMSGAREVLARADATLSSVQRLVDENQAAIGRSVANVETFTTTLAASSEPITRALDNVSAAAADLSSLSARLEGVVARGDAVIAAIDPAQVRLTVDNVASFTTALAGQTETVAQVMQRLTSVSGDLAAFSGRLGSFGDRFDTLLTDVGGRAGTILAAVDPERVGRVVGNLERITAAVEPEKVTTTLAGLASFGETLSTRQADLDAAMTRFAAISTDVSGFTGRLPAWGDRATTVLASLSDASTRANDALSGLEPGAVGVAVTRVGDAAVGIARVTEAIPTETVATTVENVGAFSKVLSERSADLDAFATRLPQIGTDVAGFTARLPVMGERIDGIVAAIDPATVSAAVTDVSSAASGVARITGAIPTETVASTVESVGAFSKVLGDRSPDLDAFAARLPQIGTDVSGFSARLPGLGERVDALVAAVDPAAVSAAVTDVSSAASGVARITGAIPTETVASTVESVGAFSKVLGDRSADLDAFAARLPQIGTDVSGFSARLPGLGERVDALVAAVDPAAVSAAVTDVSAAASGVARVAAAVPAETVAATVENVGTFSKVLAGRSADLDAFAARLPQIGTDVSGFTTRLPAVGERLDGLVAAIDPAAINGAVTDVSAAAASVRRTAEAVPSERVNAMIDGFASLGETFARREGDIDGLVVRMSTIAADVSGFSARLPAYGERFDAVVAAVDPAKIDATVEGARKFATALGDNSDDVDAILANTRAVSEDFGALAKRADSVLAKIDGMMGEGSDSFLAEARTTLQSIRAAADTFDTQAKTIGVGVDKFTTTGLKELQAFVRDGQRAVGRLDRVLSNLEKDPSQVLFGGPGVPTFDGVRKRR